MSIQNPNLVEQLRALLGPTGLQFDLHELVDELQPYDLSLIIQELDSEEQLRLLQKIPLETAAETLGHFEPIEQYRFLDHLDNDTMVAILNHMSSDAVVQLFTSIHPRQMDRLFNALQDPFKTQIRDQMAYPENTAASIATVDYIAARRWWTAAQTLAHLRKVGSKVELYNYIYVLGPKGELAGVLSLRELILSPQDTPVEEIMTEKTVSVLAELDQEEAARLLAQYDLVALPVVRSSGKMVGVITVDDILDIIEDEATEDIHLLGGSQPLDSPYLHAGFFSLFRKRIVWLLLLFVAGAITSNILGHYEGILSKVVALSFFIPLLIGTGGNAGAQTSTMVIRALAVGEVAVKDFLKVIWREMRLGFILGLAMAVIGFLRAVALKSDMEISLTVSITIIAVVPVSSTIGAVMPIIGKRLGLDPAVFSAPMITTVADALGLIIYFQIARVVLGI